VEQLQSQFEAGLIHDKDIFTSSERNAGNHCLNATTLKTTKEQPATNVDCIRNSSESKREYQHMKRRVLVHFMVPYYRQSFYSA